ncbi:MAG TPA: hypothetical protein VEK33_07600 [Terriglobales bacterium]|nr:hypothetical protein [Terriglobales bacterium]
MNTFRSIPVIILLLAVQISSASSNRETNLGPNAALLYWTAFSEMQDSAISDAKELNKVLDGKVPYDDLKYKDLVEKNRFALDIMARGASRPFCDWGLGYGYAEEMGPATPVGYVWKARALGSLNVLYAFHLQAAGERDASVRALAAGILFSHDVANGGTLVSALVAKRLLLAHFNAVALALHTGGLSTTQRLVLQKAIAQLGPEGIDWQSAVHREMEVLHRADPSDSAALAEIEPVYLKALNNPSTLSALESMRSSAPPALKDIIPNPKRVLDERQELSDKMLQVRSLLQ